MPVDLSDPELLELLAPLEVVTQEWHDGTRWRSDSAGPTAEALRTTRQGPDAATIARWLADYVEPVAIPDDPGDPGRQATRQAHLRQARLLVQGTPRAIDGILAAREYVSRFR